jgi:DNA-binding HxlR family transcriptional regulator
LRPEASIGLRFNELQKELSWVSPKILTQRLRELQEAEILTRTVDATNIPPAVWYKLTEKGSDLIDTLEAMQAWGQRHGGHVVDSCERRGFAHCRECRH